MKIQLTSYEGNIPVSNETIESGASRSFGGATWNVNIDNRAIVYDNGRFEFPGREYSAVCRIESGAADNCSFGVSELFSEWSADNYVLIPAAVYNGNRYDARSMPYAPLLKNP